MKSAERKAESSVEETQSVGGAKKAGSHAKKSGSDKDGAAAVIAGGMAAHVLLTPYKRFFNRLEAVVDREHGLGQLMVRGIESSGDDSDEDEDEDEDEENEGKRKDGTDYTEEDMKKLLFIIITQRRADEIENKTELLLGDQYGDMMLMFNTSYSYEVLEAFETFQLEYKKTKDWAVKFDILFAMTHAMAENNTWMHDHEVGWGGETMVASLARMWKGLLAKDDATLGVDPEFTRPGIVHFLQKFKNEVEDIDTCDEEMKFKFQ